MKTKKLLSLTLSLLMGIQLIAVPTIHVTAANPVTFTQFNASINDGEPIRGVDISSVLAVEKAGVKFYNENGTEQDIFRTLSEHHVNYIRVRVWNHPYDNSGRSYGAGNCDVQTAAEIGKRCAQYGMKLLVDFHYSDFWADPGKQTVPKAWQSFTHEQKKSAIYNFTTESLRMISESGADIGMVQVGNETNCFFCGEDDMYKISDLFSAGCKAVRDFNRDILIALHFTNPNKEGYYDWYAEVLNECQVDYDVFASSYYSYWHGTIENLTNVLSRISSTYNKYVMVAETAYPYTNSDGDQFGNAVVSTTSDVTLRYPISVEGQSQALTDVFQAVANVGEKGLGVFYWEPAWIGVEGLSWEAQHRLWNEYGSGWATDYAREYDRAATSAGGSAYDNQGLFDFSGKPLPSLDVFGAIYPQNELIMPKIEGDVNTDGALTIADVITLQKWLMGEGAETLSDWKAGDFTADERLTVSDLSKMKERLFQQSKP